ncbi:MAG: flagellar basal body-associated FliL family protein [Balneolaceae bacterium]|jgi:flagellar basal body-associated protein FliL|nr:flagellar basal body-associated FliL family protein [Balneolaceae bacterium]MCR9133444.1 flagellar basal body-associated FliL family protein [bacterium]
MAENKKNTKDKKGDSKSKGAPNKLVAIGKIFLLVLILAGQAYLAYVIVDSYYPSLYAKMNEEEPPEMGTYMMEQLVVNPANTNGRRYLMVEISLEMHLEHIPLMETNNPKVKQDLIEAFSSRTVSELTTAEEREVLRQEVTDIINSSIGETSVQNLYFTKYVLQ